MAEKGAPEVGSIAWTDQVLVGPKGMGGGRYCVIRDPAGAVCALYQTKA